MGVVREEAVVGVGRGAPHSFLLLLGPVLGGAGVLCSPPLGGGGGEESGSSADWFAMKLNISCIFFQ